MNAEFCNLVKESLPHDAAERLLCALSGTELSPTIRLNPFKTKGDVSENQCVLEVLKGAEELWCKGAFKLAERPDFTLDPAFHAGAYYVQDSSSMFPYLIADEIDSALGANGVLLDLCASPGGKSTHLISLFAKEGRIFLSNEAVPKRTPALTDNLAKWGVSRLIATNRDPKNLGRLEGLFDVILADVPCSGEGMFMRSSDALNDWSLRTVEECAVRQRSIISDIWPALKEGGLLVYSTCTYNHKENSDNVRYIIDELGAEYVPVDKALAIVPGLLKLDYGYQFALGSVEGEGQFFAVLRKRSDVHGSNSLRSGGKIFKKLASSFYFNKIDNSIYYAPSDVAEKMCSIAEAIEGGPSSGKRSDTASSALRYVKMFGCRVGSLKGSKVVPDADFALEAHKELFLFRFKELGAELQFTKEEVDRETALRFLARENITPLPGWKQGYVLLCYNSLGLGFINNLGNRCNNLYPQERRIRKRL